MADSYTKKYISIYFFQGLSIILGFISLFIVLPYISSDKDLYGVYAICTSLTIYFSYADLGFGAAGQKFAVESFVNHDRDEEMRIIGFTTFVFLVLMTSIALLILLLSIQPDFLLKGITDDNILTARWLLIILALSSPVLAMNRALNVIYSIRLEDYKFQQIHIVCNIIKILSVFFFFTGGRYLLVPYYFFVNIMGLVSALWALFYVKRKYNYQILRLIKNIKFNKTVFDKIKGLAFAGLVSMICWILYYELDQIAIGTMFDVKAVATYSIAFSVLTYFRTYFGVIFSPLTARFNYFIGEGNTQGLNEHLCRVCCFFLPFVVFPILAVVIFAEPFVITWVGGQYIDSIIHTRLLVVCNILAFITYPASAYIMALQKSKEIVKMSMFIALVYWLGIIILQGKLELLSFSLMKTVAFLLSAVYYVYLIIKFQKTSSFKFVFSIIKPYILPLLITVGLGIILLKLYHYEDDKSVTGLFLSMGLMGLFVLSGLLLSSWNSSIIKEKIIEIRKTYGK